MMLTWLDKGDAQKAIPTLAKVLRIPAAHIRVIACPNGGGFGGKSDIFNHEIVVAKAALMREESRGAHFREDFPETADLEQSRFSRVTLPGGDGVPGDLKLEMVPVDFTIVRPGESLIDEEAGAPPEAA